MKSVPETQKWICQPHPSMVVGDVVVVVVGSGRMLYDICIFMYETYIFGGAKSNPASMEAQKERTQEKTTTPLRLTRCVRSGSQTARRHGGHKGPQRKRFRYGKSELGIVSTYNR